MSTGILLVDPQYDFFPGGSLAVPDGDAILEPINTLLTRHAGLPVFASRDWHPSSTKHFRARGGIWPPHCVQDTRGAAFHASLHLDKARVYDKGTDPEDDGGYSAFDGARVDAPTGTRHTLVEDLRTRGIDTLIIAGLATDYCVKASALDARKHGLTTMLFVPGVRAVDVKPGDGERAIDEMKAAGILLLTA